MCPLRFLLALLSLGVIAYCLVSAMAETEAAAGGGAWQRMTRKDRSWPRFIVTLFTGELLWQWWHGAPADGDPVAVPSAEEDGPAPTAPPPAQ
jgi:hypothetical protein